nr:MAG TPA: hypothetical protein [Caudoviricetes sp.]
MEPKKPLHTISICVNPHLDEFLDINPHDFVAYLIKCEDGAIDVWFFPIENNDNVFYQVWGIHNGVKETHFKTESKKTAPPIICGRRKKL